MLRRGSTNSVPLYVLVLSYVSKILYRSTEMQAYTEVVSVTGGVPVAVVKPVISVALTVIVLREFSHAVRDVQRDLLT